MPTELFFGTCSIEFMKSAVGSSVEELSFTSLSFLVAASIRSSL